MKTYGEASPSYSSYPQSKGVPAKMYALVPSVRIIYVVRDPIDRLLRITSTTMHLARKEDLSRRRWPNRNYIWRSSYFMQLEQYLGYFSLSRFLVVDREDLLHDRRRILRRIFSFLEVDPGFDSPSFDRLKYESHVKRRPVPLPGTISKSRLAHLAGRVLPARARGAINKIVRSQFSYPIQPPVLDPTLRERLTDALKPDADRLRQLTGRDFAHWSV